MDLLNFSSFADLAEKFDALPLYPLFDISHYIVMIVQLRQDAGIGAQSLAETNALACWLCGMLSCFGGKFVANFLLGQPIIAAFAYTHNVIIATIVWYLMMYSPGDICYKCVTNKLGKMIVYPFKEISRSKKIASGVLQAAQVYPQGWFVMIMIGTIKGTGSLFIRNVERLLRGVWTPTKNEIMRPSGTFKLSVVCASFLTLQKMGLIPLPWSQVIFLMAMVFVPYKISVILLHVGDPFLQVEKVLRPLLFQKWNQTTKSEDRNDSEEKSKNYQEGRRMAAFSKKAN